MFFILIKFQPSQLSLDKNITFNFYKIIMHALLALPVKSIYIFLMVFYTFYYIKSFSIKSNLKFNF